MRFLKVQIDERIEKTRVIQKAFDEALKKLQSMEESFPKLNQVTVIYVLVEVLYTILKYWCSMHTKNTDIYIYA